MEENELLLSQLEEYKNNLSHQNNTESTKSDQDLVNQCQELERELFKTVEMNDELNSQVLSLKKQIEDWKVYAEDTENELEAESESLLEAETKNADLLVAMNILDQQLQDANDQNEKNASQSEQNKGSLAQMLEMQSKEQKRLIDQCSMLEIDLDKAKEELDDANDNLKAIKAAKKDLQTLLEEAVEDIQELEEATEKLNAVIIAKDQLQRLLDKALLGRDEINDMYGRCKKEIHSAKEHLLDANAEKEELDRKLDIEKRVSLAYKSKEENEFDGLYREAREEMKELEKMLEESRTVVIDLEENALILQQQLQDALSFIKEHHQNKVKSNLKPKNMGNFFGWRGGGNKDEDSSDPVPPVVTDEELDDGHEESTSYGHEESTNYYELAE